MAVLRIRVELHRPNKGIEMSKLADLARETQKFFKMVADDVGIGTSDGAWIAQDFYNQSIGFDAEYQLVDIDQQQAASYTQAIGNISAVDRDTNWSVRGISPLTIVQYAKIATLAGDGESVRLGLYDEKLDMEWKQLQKD